MPGSRSAHTLLCTGVGSNTNSARGVGTRVQRLGGGRQKELQSPPSVCLPPQSPSEGAETPGESGALQGFCPNVPPL